MKTAREWKAHYARERAELGPDGLRALVADVIDLEWASGALIFPHTHLRSSGRLTAVVARAAVRSGADTVLALGVLHGAREEDAAEVELARAGEPWARAKLRRVHSESSPHVAEEFSLDNFEALLHVAADFEGKKAPRLVKRFPFLTGTEPETLPGFEELVTLKEAGAVLVATADPIHHGAGYDTPPSERIRREAASGFARSTIQRGLDLLAGLDFEPFLEHCRSVKSDFRDPGPVLAALLARDGPLVGRVREVDLADYAATLGAEEPTWVAGAVSSLEVRPKRAEPQAARS